MSNDNNIDAYTHDLKHAPYCVFYFTAKWCGPCKKISPVWESLEKEYGDNVVFHKVDVDNCSDFVSSLDDFKVTSLPTMLLYRNGQFVASTAGANEQSWCNALRDLMIKNK